jgi:hypothetical protein
MASLDKKCSKGVTYTYYFFVGLTASVLLLDIFYWSLNRNTSLAGLLVHNQEFPYYFVTYIFLNLLISVLFGINISFLIYRWRKFGSPFTLKASGSGIGAILGIIASSCPVCGTTILSTIGVMSGLSVMPFDGLEIKFISILFLLIPLFLMWKDTKKTTECNSSICVKAKNHYLSPNQKHYAFVATIVFIITFLANIWFIGQDPIFTGKNKYGGSCPQQEIKK